MPASDSLEKVFKKVLVQGSILIGIIAALGSAIGFAVAGQAGLISALIGAALTLVFVSLTALSVWFGGKLPLGGFFGVVMGGWLVKLVVFLVLAATLKEVDFIDGPVFFFTVVAAIISTLVIDTRIALSARIPLYEK
ncbi:hypothetical protein [Candidatus Rhodoluna planktonica]|uniref:ATP synthase protein I n=1 Tax=Candidatus Rhodoluna planktonica TaxID=535712 RepID=A0A1D9DZN4_9MICO|nr:hypothetical protein [Candidatus Rhodoluna planktonica]AOY56282.1 hypothetical protein A4Z71_04795 [Candidatus Rhodoluna planktonica]